MKENRNPENLIKGAASLGIDLREKELEQFLLFHEMLVETNRVCNLTAITEWEEVITRHFLDSLSLVKAVKLSDQRLLDLGTGAGFPGIPLKIAFPKLSITLADSLEKRVQFLKTVIEELQLSDVTVIHGRAEDLGQEKGQRETFDIVVSRAVASLNVLSEYCLPFVKPGGIFVSYKGGETEEEVLSAKEAIQKLGGKVEEVLKFSLNGTDQKRSLLVIAKEKPTPPGFPRRAGVPKKKPL